MTDHSMWHELAAGHALHALDAGDEARLLAHLSECDECRSELDAHTLTASHLASLADDDETTPPPWSEIKAVVIGSPSTAAPEVVDLAERRRGPLARRLLAAAAAVIVIAGVTVAAVDLLGAGGGSRQPASALSQCTAARHCVTIDLRSSDGSRRAAVIVSGDAARVQPLAMSAPAKGRTFVLWQLPRAGRPIALGEFSSTTAPSTANLLAVPMSRTTAFAVSSEPAGVPPKKPSDILALGGVTAA